MEKVLNQEEIDAMVRVARGKSVDNATSSRVKPWNFLEAGQMAANLSELSHSCMRYSRAT